VKKTLSGMKEGAWETEVNSRLTRTDVLVSDKISMCESNFFMRLNELMKEARDSTDAFSSVQLIVTGDISSRAGSGMGKKLTSSVVLPVVSCQTLSELFQLRKPVESRVRRVSL
jgi:hypothetical protein